MTRKLCKTEEEAREFASQKHFPGWEQIAMVFKIQSGWYVQIVEASSGANLELLAVYHNGNEIHKTASGLVSCVCGAPINEDVFDSD